MALLATHISVGNEAKWPDSLCIETHAPITGAQSYLKSYANQKQIFFIFAKSLETRARARECMMACGHSPVKIAIPKCDPDIFIRHQPEKYSQNALFCVCNLRRDLAEPGSNTAWHVEVSIERSVPTQGDCKFHLVQLSPTSLPSCSCFRLSVAFCVPRSNY